MASKSSGYFFLVWKGLQRVWAPKLGSHDPRILESQVFVSIGMLPTRNLRSGTD
jgi:hypothetical protein